MNELTVVENKDISSMIYEIRGVQVMLDSDLAILYGVETKRINESVSRNKAKFPTRYSWILTIEEENILWSQNATANMSSKSRTRHRVFTEQGVAMLATILKSKIAINVSIAIMDAFVSMRKYISDSLYPTSQVLKNHEDRIIKLENTFDAMSEKSKVNTIFFEGQIYDAYSLLLDILNESKKEIIIIDNYAGKELLDILKDVDKKILIISNNITDTLISKYKKQYNNIEFKRIDLFHDRFIIIDNKVMYHSGSSFKDLGKKCFAINKFDDKEVLCSLLGRINEY